MNQTKKYRLHRQAQAPLIFNTLEGVVAYLQWNKHSWYELEESVDNKWVVVITRENSRTAVNRHRDPGTEDTA